MTKAIAVAGAVMFVVVLVLSAGLSPICALCVPLISGTLAGFLTGVWEKNPGTVVRRGATAGAIVGAIALVAQIGASLINAAILQDPDLQLNRAFGLPPTEASLVWAVQLGVACFVGLVNVGLTAGLGAAGGALWKSTSGNAMTPAAPTGM